ncbi:hypothetical protein BLNAU_5109 [Blattamonas nauphoetae]|uniref:Uncharacterized protein n=1 Tax=Blattamonas nauphoetae TaxID=2049346 RepID=A0ABQ9Y820_9EUKA|nr:hypothetical protein BLNAU_5109 [Blattamonas nauphoetae]
MSRVILAQLVYNHYQFKNDRIMGLEETNVSDSEPASGCVENDVMDSQENADIRPALRTRSMILTNVPVVLDLIGLLEKAAAGPSNKNILFRVSQIDKETVSLLKDHAIDGSFVFSELQPRSRLFTHRISTTHFNLHDGVIKKLINASPVLNVLTLHELCIIWLRHNDEISPHAKSQIREENRRIITRTVSKHGFGTFLDDMTARISTLLPFDITPDDTMASSRKKRILSTSFPSLPTNLRVTTDVSGVSSRWQRIRRMATQLGNSCPSASRPTSQNKPLSPLSSSKLQRTLSLTTPSSPICFDSVSHDRQCGRIAPSWNDTSHITLLSFPATLTAVPWRRSSHQDRRQTASPHSDGLRVFLFDCSVT